MTNQKGFPWWEKTGDEMRIVIDVKLEIEGRDFSTLDEKICVFTDKLLAMPEGAINVFKANIKGEVERLCQVAFDKGVEYANDHPK